MTTTGGSYQLNGAKDIQYDNGLLYVAANGSNAVNIFDVSLPENPVFVNSIAHNAANPLLNGVTGIHKV